MNQYLNYCEHEGINVYMSNTDSVAIPTKDVHKFQRWLGPKLGQLHIEIESREAIIIRANCYYMSDDWFRFSGKSHDEIRATGDIRSFYKELL
jgi:hypothetical protein